MADADIVDDKADILAFSADTVHPRNGLQEIVRLDDLIEIHDLLDGRIEARQQHVVDDHDADIALDAFLLAVKRQLEALDDAFVLGRIAMRGEVRRIVVLTRNHDAGL